jgi:hypothetical protein
MAIMMVTLGLLLGGIHKMTGLKLEEVLHGAPPEEASKDS